MSAYFPNITRRMAPRRPVDVACTIVSSSLGRRSGTISDISRIGCRVCLHCRFVEHAVVLVTMPTFGPIAARVVWSTGSMAGLKFVRPLGAAVVALVSERHRRPGETT